MFTRKTVHVKEYSKRRSNLEIDQTTIDEPAYALLQSISKSNGVEHGKVFQKSVNVAKFLSYVNELRDSCGQRKICIFMDNLSVHRSPKVLGKLDEYGIKYAFNLPYSPDYNPIEFVFLKIKQAFKMTRLQKIARGIKPNIETIIRKAVKQVKKTEV